MSEGRLAPSPESARPSNPRRGPNYAARRMLVSTIGVAVIVAAGVAVWRTTRDGSAEAETASGEWNEVVFVDRTNGATTSVDRDGSASGTLPATSRAIAAHAEGERVALVEATQIVLTDLADAAPDIIPIDANAVVTRLPIAESLWLAVGNPTGGNVVLIDGLTGDTYDFGALAEFSQPNFFVDTLRYDPAGRVFAIAGADATNFQTVLVDTEGDPVEARFFPDQPLAVDHEHVVTSQVVGQQADLTLFDADRKNLATVVESLPAGATLDDDEVIVASIDGAVSRFGEGDEQAERIGAIAVPAGSTINLVRSIADGTRWVVAGEVFEAIVDLEGRTVFTTSFSSPIERPRIEPGWSCLPVGGGDSFHSIVGAENGEQVANLSGLAVTGVSADGCTVIGTRAGAYEVVGRDGSAQLGRVRSATLAPDGRAVVVQQTTGATELIPIDDDFTLGDPVDLTDVAPTNALITFRQT